MDKGYVWMDGTFFEFAKANVSGLTHALHYASSVFEGERCYNGKVFRADDHQRRLLKSCQIMDMKCKYTVDEINDAIYATLKKNGLRDAYIRPLVYMGQGGMSVSTEHNEPRVLIAAWGWPALFGDDIENGLKLKWATYRKPGPESEPVEAKASGLYMISMIEENRALREGFDDVLFLDCKGFVAECGSSNVFFVMNGNELHTPTTRSSLDGITRKTIIEIAEKKGIKVVVRDITQEEVSKANEVFITGTAAEVMPVGRVGTQAFKTGSITRELREAYLKMVNS